MKNTFLTAAVVGAVAGFAGAFSASALLGPSAASEPQEVAVASAPAKPDTARVESLEDELADLRTENRMLAQRVELLEQRPVAAAREAVPAGPDPDVAQLQDQMRTLVAAFSGGDELPPNVASTFRGLVDTIEEEKQEEREQRWAEAREQEMNARIERLTNELGLDDYQSNELRVILEDERAKREQLFADARENGTWTNLREEMRTVRDEVNESLELLFTPDQLELYNETERRRFGGFGGGPPGGGPGAGRR